ncbi:MAG: FAD-dependent oxidoreductase [Gammaproteobacteria bacterium]|nr:FAD-dependent oxidoreductase [Gammaproteobacteria bacterium]
MKTYAYWNDHRSTPAGVDSEKPASVDVAIIGAGFTGLSTALALARGGRRVAVIDAGEPGSGCSSRNGGMIGPSMHKLGLRGLTAKYGDKRAKDILAEGLRAIDFFRSFLATEAIECDLQMTGRFRGAMSDKDFRVLIDEVEDLKKIPGFKADVVPYSEQHQEVGSDLYRGGIVYHQDGGLNPAKLVDALCRKVADTGALIISNTPVQGWSREKDGYELRTASGSLRAKEIVVATNGYTPYAFRKFRRRIIPIRSAIAVTEELDTDLIERLSPRRRMHGDTRRLVVYYRRTPDGKRLLLGSRTQGPLDQYDQIAATIRKTYTRIYPELEPIPFSHCWAGTVAYTFDHAPHTGSLDGIHYAMGYCGSGVVRSVYLGTRLAGKILGRADSQTAFDDLPFTAPFYYWGYPLGLNWLMKWHALRDRMI